MGVVAQSRADQVAILEVDGHMCNSANSTLTSGSWSMHFSEHVML